MKNLLLVGTLSAMLLAGCGESTESLKEVSTTEMNVATGEKKEVATEESLNEKVVISLDNLTFIEPDYDNFDYDYKIKSDITFTNTTDKDVRGVSGTIFFYDIFGEVMHKSTVKYDYDVIAANTSNVWDANLVINQFVDREWKLFNTPFENIVFKYEIDKIIFTDGTEL